MSCKHGSQTTDQMWEKACLLTRLVASCVRVSETAGLIIKDIMQNGDLKIINKGTALKEDPQTEADRAAQYCIVKSLHKRFGDKLKIIGEEEVTSAVEELELSYSSEVLSRDNKCPSYLRDIDISEVVVWVDPLDGTCEFAEACRTGSPLLQHVTVLIGISYQGRAVAGVIRQPYFGADQAGRTIWGIVGEGVHGIEVVTSSEKKTVVTTRSHTTSTVMAALDALKDRGMLDNVVTVGGAGYKVIKCLEGASAYVFASPGCKKWDTAAPEAILIAAGGCLTDISGRALYYGADAQILNSGGVLATPNWVNHKDYVDAIPAEVKAMLPEVVSRQS